MLQPNYMAAMPELAGHLALTLSPSATFTLDAIKQRIIPMRRFNKSFRFSKETALFAKETLFDRFFRPFDLN